MWGIIKLMTMERLVVFFGGVGLIIFTYWYFFMKNEKKVVTEDTVDVLVKGGYQPSTIAISYGKKIKINFKRVDESSCLQEVVFPDFKIKRFLPLNKTVTIEISPDKKGVYNFHCGMAMFHGKLIVE